MENPTKIWMIWGYPYDLGNLHLLVNQLFISEPKDAGMMHNQMLITGKHICEKVLRSAQGRGYSKKRWLTQNP